MSQAPVQWQELKSLIRCKIEDVLEKHSSLMCLWRYVSSAHFLSHHFLSLYRNATLCPCGQWWSESLAALSIHEGWQLLCKDMPEWWMHPHTFSRLISLPHVGGVQLFKCVFPTGQMCYIRTHRVATNLYDKQDSLSSRNITQIWAEETTCTQH